ncbi:41473_t:CDS:1, partial [Gigaspora margarita]
FDFSDNVLYDCNQIENENIINCKDTYEIILINMINYKWDGMMNRIDNQTELDNNNNNENDQYEELKEELMFHNWNHAANKVDKYRKRQGFKMCYYCVEKLKSRDIQRCTIVCDHFG